MTHSSTRWRVSPAGWVVVALAVTAESVSNALRAYGLGAHLDRFTVHVSGHAVSLAGSVLVLAAIAVSLSQARAAWVALTPLAPARQRVVAGLAASLLLAVSVTAMASHILEATRAKMADEGGARGAYDRARTAYDKAAADLAELGTPRPVAVIQAEVQATRIDMGVWRRSDQCADITRDDTKEACRPILTLYKERGVAARKAELEPEVERLRKELARLERPEEVSTTETTISAVWAWIMGLAVVFVATFGSVIFARVERLTVPAARDTVQTSFPAPAPVGLFRGEQPDPPGGGKTKQEALADLLTLTAMGRPIESQDWLASRWKKPKGRVSKWLSEWERMGLVSRATIGRCKAVSAPT